MTRRTEIDTLRGILLFVMALTHLPTRFSRYADQPLGFVSTAEGFIFLSAFLAARGYSHLLKNGQVAEIRRRARARALRLYYWHLGMLALVFTLGAGFAYVTGRPGLSNLLSVFFADPFAALLGAAVLAYQPPLLDILPMYIAFLALTPAVLAASAREGWGKVLTLSVLVWLFAQFNGRSLLFGAFTSLVGWPLPLESLGAFDWLAWQIVWIAGLATGLNASVLADRFARMGNDRLPLLIGATALTCVFFIWRHRGAGAAVDVWSDIAVNKWHLGILRIVNFAVIAVFVGHFVVPLLKSSQLGWLARLGRASLPVFCAHVVACLVSVALIVDGSTVQQLRYEWLMIGGTLAAMFIVAAKAASRSQARHAELSDTSSVWPHIAPRARVGSLD